MKKVILFPVMFLLVPVIVAAADENYYAAPGQIKLSALSPGENWVAIRNIGDTEVDLAGWVLYDESDAHELFLTEPDIIGGNAAAGLGLGPGGEVVISGKNDNDFRLYNGGGEVRLFSGPVEIAGTLEDKVSYPAIGEGESYQVIVPPEDQTPDQTPSDNSNDNSNGNPNEDSSEVTIGSNSSSDYAKHDYQTPENTNSNFDITNQDNPEVNKNNKSRSENGANKKEKSDISLQSREASNPTIRNSENLNPENSQENLNLNENNNQGTPTFTASSRLEKSPWGWFYWLWHSWFLRRIIIPLIGLWLALYVIVYFVKKKLAK